VAFLHQHQRTIGDDGGEPYIEASLDDYAIAYDLAHQVFADSAHDLPKPARDFLAQVKGIVDTVAKKAKAGIGETWFTRRMIREATKLPDHIIKRHMREIEDLEYVVVQRAPQGGSFRYRLLPQKQAPALLDGLLSPESLARKVEQVGQKWKSGKNGRKPA